MQKTDVNVATPRRPSTRGPITPNARDTPVRKLTGTRSSPPSPQRDGRAGVISSTTAGPTPDEHSSPCTQSRPCRCTQLHHWCPPHRGPPLFPGGVPHTHRPPTSHLIVTLMASRIQSGGVPSGRRTRLNGDRVGCLAQSHISGIRYCPPTHPMTQC